MSTNKIKQYRLALLSSIRAQQSGNIDSEDEFLAHMDSLWLSMTAVERAEANEIARRVGAGEMPLEQLILTESASVLDLCVWPSTVASVMYASEDLIGRFDSELIREHQGPRVFANSKPGSVMPEYPFGSTKGYEKEFPMRQVAVC